MCRLFAISDTSIAPAIRRDLLDRAMLLHMGEGQDHGWGITDGIGVWKGSGRYGRDVSWMDHTAQDTVLIGHVRHASADTGRTAKEAHPFQLSNFIGVHNGFFDIDLGVTPAGPDSDTYRGFLALQWVWDKPAPLTPIQCERWLCQMYDQTGMAVMLLPSCGQGRLFQLYKDARTRLFYCQVGNGYMWATSQTVMRDLRYYLRSRTGRRCGLIGVVPPFHLFTVQAGSAAYHTDRVPFSPQPTPLGKRVWRWLNS